MTVSANSPDISDADLSPFYTDAGKNAVRAQRRHAKKLQTQLALLIIAAVCGAFTFRFHHRGADYAGLAGAFAFVAAIFVRLYSEHEHDETQWYKSRAAAESAKTLSWRYSVCGNPFPESMPDREAKRLLVSRFEDIGRELEYIEVSPSQAPGGEVTESMTSLRHAPRPDRIRVYGQQRILSQEDWYAGKSAWNEGRARLWLKIVIGVELCGLIGAAVKAAGVPRVDLLGVFAAIGAAAGAWLQFKQHKTLATAYNVTARELRRVSTLIDDQMSADDWADFVDQAEEAISREHMMWVASRTGRQPRPS